MTKNSSFLLTKCFRFPKSFSIPPNRSQLTSQTCPSDSSPLTSIVEAIQTIDQLVQTAELNCHQQGDSNCIPKSMNIEQIEEMLVKWTHIAHFLVETYEQIQNPTRDHIPK